MKSGERCHSLQYVQVSTSNSVALEDMMAEVDWQDIYKIAVLESDPSLLQERIDSARDAIHQHLTLHRHALSKRESDDLNNALRILMLLGRGSISAMKQ
jgi:hypothetical protein